MPTTQQVFETGKIGITRSRSIFDLSHSAKFTMSAGRLTPCLAYSDVLPGDTHKLDMSFVCRSTTPVRPIMDNAYMQVEFWYVSNKSVLHRSSMSPSLDDSNHSWAAFIGAQDNLLNMPLPGEIRLPGVQSVIDDFTDSVLKERYLRSPACYLDYPLEYDSNYEGSIFNPFAVLSLYSVWSYAYREPNLWNPVTFTIESGLITFTPNSQAGIYSPDDFYSNIASFQLPKVCREHGYFGSALPWPQRNLNGVVLGLAGTAPLDTIDDVNDFESGLGLKFGTEELIPDASAMNLLIGHTSGSDGDVVGGSSGPYSGDGNVVNGSNLVADLSKVSAVAINELRYAFALQGYYEALARMGNRYDDILAYYGVYRDVLDCDQPEYLGGKRIPLDVTQVNNTADNTGQIGAFSNTSSSDHYFTKSFQDFGTILGVCFIRHHDTVYQRMSKERTRRERFDYWNPAFARIGEVPVYSRELFIGFGTYDMGYGVDVAKLENTVFGYQEYGAEYRYHENCVRGRLIPYIGDLAYWTYASDWANGGTYDENNMIDLSTFLDASEQVSDFDQTLEVSDETAGYQFIVDMYFNWIAVRNIPAHSIPALLGGR